MSLNISIHQCKTLYVLLIISGILLISTGCTPEISINESSGITEVDNPAATEVVQIEPSDTPRVPTLTPTITLSPTVTKTKYPTLTKVPSLDPNKTLTPVFDNMTDLISALIADGIINSVYGKYTRLEDFDESWAQINWYQWHRTGIVTENFVIRVDASWESASRKADWDLSGCGFVFSDSGKDTHHAVFLTMDGYVRTHKFVNRKAYGQQSGFFGTFTPVEDSAEIVLVVEDDIITVFVDKRLVVRYTDPYIKRGNLSLSLMSGTNIGFGTRCVMENIDVWEIDGVRD